MKRVYTFMLALFIPLLAWTKQTSISQQHTPMVFVENKGQITDQYRSSRGDIQFKLQSQGVCVFIGDAQLHYQWYKTDATDIAQIKAGTIKPNITIYRMDVTLLGADKHAPIVTEAPQSFYEHYYKEQFSTAGAVAHSFKKITYKNVYPNIDWVLYISTAGDQEVLEYDFVVRPGGNAADIKLQYAGNTGLALNENGSITATTPMGSITEKSPYSYTAENNNQTSVTSSYHLKNNVLGFNVGSYNGTLVIDPSLVWSTYYGGDGYIDFGEAIACNPSGDVYFSGRSFLVNNIATTGAFQTTPGSAYDYDGALIKFNRAGNCLWGTYYGGSGADATTSLACDGNLAVYMAGFSNTPTGLATPNSFLNAAAGNNDAILVKFDSAGNRIWGTYYGGTGIESTTFSGVAVDGKGAVYLTSSTTSTAGIASGGFQNTLAGDNDALLVKFDTAGVRQWATYYGGTGTDYAMGVSCDSSGNVYLAGYTNSTNGISTTGSHQATLGGDADNFLVKFNSAGARQWATYYGGSSTEGYDFGTNIVACDLSNNVFMSSSTKSTDNIASANADKDTLGSPAIEDGYIVKFDSMGTRQWGTYFGGEQYESPYGLSTDAQGDVLSIGSTASKTGIALGHVLNDTISGRMDGYLVAFDKDGAKKWGTYFGGSSSDVMEGVACDSVGNIYITGNGGSQDRIATTGAYATTFTGLQAKYLARFCSSVMPANSIISGADTVCANSSETYSVTKLADNSATYIWTLPAGWKGTSDSSSINIVSNDTSGVISVRIIKCNDTSTANNLPVQIRQIAPVVITVNGFVLGTASPYNSYQWYLNGTAIPNATNPTYTVTQNGRYTVDITTANGCKDSTSYTVTNVSVSSLEQLGNAIFIYPNPASNIVYIQSPVAVNLTISTIQGAVVSTNNNAKTVDISNLAKGVYMLRITDSKGTLLKVDKIVKIAE